MNKVYQSVYPLKNILMLTLLLGVFTAGRISQSHDDLNIPFDVPSIPSAIPQIKPTESIPSLTQDNRESSPEIVTRLAGSIINE